jgi:hypothetical protein
MQNYVAGKTPRETSDFVPLPLSADKRHEAWRLACDMEEPVRVAIALVHAVYMMAMDTDNEDSAALSEVVRGARRELDKVYEARGELFHILYPFDRENVKTALGNRRVKDVIVADESDDNETRRMRRKLSEVLAVAGSASS